jgi:tetratricopeptide (TPR) repeat protein
VKADRKKRQCTEAEEKKMKELLEQLYTDKQYLEKLLDETEKVNATSKTSDDIIELSTECLDYLDTRATFWQQKEPTYSKERNRKLQESTRDKTETLVKRGDNKGDATSWIMKNLQQIDDDQMVGKYEESLRRAEKVLKRTEQFNDQELPRRFELEAHLHSYIGNAHLELGHLNEALKHHQKDYNIAKQHNLPEASARAIDNIGRVFIRQHKYKQAIQLFDERLPTVSHPLEKTWLFHEIGRCYLELGNASKALEFGEQSMEAATDACDHTWQLNASVLLAQANVKLRQYEEAVDCFERALDLAKCADDPEAISAIESAIRDVHRLIHDNTRDEHSDSPDSKTHMKSGHDITDADANSSSPRDESSPGRHSPRDKGSPGKHSPPEKSSPDRHSPRDKGSPDRHSPQLKSSPGKHSPPKKNSPDKHSPRDKGSPGRHSPQDNSSPGRHSPLDNSSPGRHSPRDKGSPDRHSPGDKGSPDRHSPQDKGSPDRHSLQDNSSPGRHSPRDKDLPGEHSPQDNSSPGRHTPQDDSSPGKHSLEEKSSPDRHSPGDKGSPVDIKEYKVTIKISDVDNAAGSDFNGLYVQLTGDRGTTGQLDLELGNRKLERTTENEFTVKAIDVGQINQVLLGHRSSSSGLGPHVAQVHVHSESTEDSYTFHCHQWLDSSKEIQLCRVPTNLRVDEKYNSS